MAVLSIVKSASCDAVLRHALRLLCVQFQFQCRYKFTASECEQSDRRVHMCDLVTGRCAPSKTVSGSPFAPDVGNIGRQTTSNFRFVSFWFCVAVEPAFYRFAALLEMCCMTKTSTRYLWHEFHVVCFTLCLTCEEQTPSLYYN